MKTALTITIIALLLAFAFPTFIIRVHKKIGLPTEPDYRDLTWKYYINRSLTINPESDQLVFLGDSRISGISVESHFNAINYGISGETVARAKERAGELANMENKRIVLAYGINDIPRPTADIVKDYKELINKFPKSATVYICAVLPINEKTFKGNKTNSQINELNEALRKLDGVRHIDSGKHFCPGECFKDDGIHLSYLGNIIWTINIGEAVGMPWDYDGNGNRFMNNTILKGEAPEFIEK